MVEELKNNPLYDLNDVDFEKKYSMTKTQYYKKYILPLNKNERAK